jgi:hypothetical protein
MISWPWAPPKTDPELTEKIIEMFTVKQSLSCQTGSIQHRQNLRERAHYLPTFQNATLMAPILRAQKPLLPASRLHIHHAPRTADHVSKKKTTPTKKVTENKMFTTRSPFPYFQRSSPQECEEAHGILAALHGEREPEATNAMNGDGVGRPAVFADPLD